MYSVPSFENTLLDEKLDFRPFLELKHPLILVFLKFQKTDNFDKHPLFLVQKNENIAPKISENRDFWQMKRDRVSAADLDEFLRDFSSMAVGAGDNNENEQGTATPGEGEIGVGIPSEKEDWRI